jgi:hypothetical protein
VDDVWVWEVKAHVYHRAGEGRAHKVLATLQTPIYKVTSLTLTSLYHYRTLQLNLLYKQLPISRSGRPRSPILPQYQLLRRPTMTTPHRSLTLPSEQMQMQSTLCLRPKPQTENPATTNGDAHKSTKDPMSLDTKDSISDPSTINPSTTSQSSTPTANTFTGKLPTSYPKPVNSTRR